MLLNSTGPSSLAQDTSVQITLRYLCGIINQQLLNVKCFTASSRSIYCTWQSMTNPASYNHKSLHT